MDGTDSREACQRQVVEEADEQGTELRRGSPGQNGRELPASQSETQTLDRGPAQISDSGQAYERCCNLVRQMDPVVRKRYLTEEPSPETKERSAKIHKILLKMTEGANYRILQTRGEQCLSIPPGPHRDQDESISRRLLESERRIRATYELYKTLFPIEIWHCCMSTCFAANASSVQIAHTLANICRTAKEMQEAVQNLNELVRSRRRGVGGSNMAFNAPSRAARENQEGRVGTDRQAALKRFDHYVGRIIPFLYASPGVQLSGVHLHRKLCTEAIHLLLGVSRNCLFRRSKRRALGADASNASKEILASIIDMAGVRMRQHRRNGDRRGFPSIEEMSTFKCGCTEPCFAKVPDWRLKRSYEGFLKISMDEKPRRKEHQFLLNIMFCPLSNSTVRQCNRAIANLFTISEGVVGAVRESLHRMCNEPSLDDRPLQPEWWKRGYSSPNHPANRMDDGVRERIENHLNMVLRPDPAGGEDRSVCRVYSTEVNTHEKLRKLLIKMLKSDTDGPVRLSSSSLQRRINEYLEARKLRISYQQTDHNACPHCKAFKLASFRYHKEHKQLETKLDALIHQSHETDLQREADKAEIEALTIELQTKKDQEDETVSSFQSHCARDRDIRKLIKQMSDHFRTMENRLLKKGSFAQLSPAWNCHKGHAVLTHQDDMTKVDLPYFVVSASADITRWRFGVNAHVSAINGDAVVFFHEQGTGPKNGSCIVEEIILDHLVRSRGESIKIVVSDNASVGKNWLCTVALPQYIVDQGLAKIVLIIFLENNHGKWLADLLFGQLQTRRKRTTLLSVDDLLTEFESINRSQGSLQSFAVNPLSSIDFSRVLASLGYEIKPPKDFNFTKRNIHFAAAAALGAKEELSDNLKQLLSPLLPDDAGMVRICSNPPNEKPYHERAFEERSFDVPAAALSRTTPNNRQEVHGNTELTASVDGSQTAHGTGAADDSSDRTAVPLVVAFDKSFSASGSGVVSHRTADHVGFNGLGFRKLPAFPELREDSDLVRRAWPPGLLTRGWEQTEGGEIRFGTEAVKCAPENWAVRRPVSRVGGDCTNIKARYPPRNLLNARYKQAPREPGVWIPTVTYTEPPFPTIKGTCAFNAMNRFSLLHREATRSVHILGVLKTVFEDMGRAYQPGICDFWLQNEATMPTSMAIDKYRGELNLYIKREKDSPVSALTVKQAFKQDAEVQGKVGHILAEQGISSTNSKARTTAMTKLFEEAENTPGGLERFEYLVERDLERCARELTEFKCVQHKFDADHGLLPVEGNR